MNWMQSQAHALQRLFDDEMRVELIAELLFAVDAETPAAETAHQLNELGFDECGIRRDGKVVEIAARDKLVEGTAGQYGQLVPIDRIVAPTTPIWSCMDRIAKYNTVFVLGDGCIDRVVTPADFTKQPARLLMFGLVSMLEMVLLDLVRLHYPDQTWREMVTPGRVAKAEGLLNEKRRRGQEINLEECLQLCDKVEICLKVETVRDGWGLTKNNALDLFKALQKIRDNLAHAQPPALDDGWPGTIENLRRGHEVLHQSVALLDQSSF